MALPSARTWREFQSSPEYKAIPLELHSLESTHEEYPRFWGTFHYHFRFEIAHLHTRIFNNKQVGQIECSYLPYAC